MLELRLRQKPSVSYNLQSFKLKNLFYNIRRKVTGNRHMDALSWCEMTSKSKESHFIMDLSLTGTYVKKNLVLL